jgi:hypothetical protein
LNHCPSYLDATIRYHASMTMYLHIHRNAGGVFLLSNAPANMPQHPDSTSPPINGTVHIHSSIMKAVLSSATKTEVGARLLLCNAKDAAPLCITLSNEMGHLQAAMPIQIGNACASGIVNDTIKQSRSKPRTCVLLDHGV